MKKWFSTLLIVLGILIALYPLSTQAYYWYWNNKLLRDFEQTLTLEIETPETSQDYLALQSLFELEDFEFEDYPAMGDFDDVDLGDEELDSEDTVEVTAPVVSAPQPAAIGRITIPKIGVNMAILEGASQKNLSRGAARIAGTSDFGVVGNVGIAGHRGYSYGVMFNRLNELETGDDIDVVYQGNTYKYKVYKVHYVLPDDMTVLYRSSTHEVITLVTCETATDPTHRLIVHAVRAP